MSTAKRGKLTPFPAWIGGEMIEIAVGKEFRQTA
jgi:hypothetical protein